MAFRTKLFLSFLGISSLIMIVGMLFYFQLKNLIEPLTPQSIPLSVDLLENKIYQNNLINQILYQQLMVEYNLENYVFTKNLVSLQNYYMNETVLSQLLDTIKQNNLSLWNEVSTDVEKMQEAQNHILKLMNKQEVEQAKIFITSKSYLDLLKNIKNSLLSYLRQADLTSSESAVVTVKIAVQNSIKILQENINKTSIIFFDAIIASLILVFLSTRAISRPINLLRNNIDKMNLDNNVTIDPYLINLKGEVGDLSRSFSALIEKLRFTTVFKDELLKEIEQRRIIETQLQQTADHLRESNLDLDEFAYAASHDLRSPLRGIENLVKWIEEDCYAVLPEESRKHFDLIKRRVQRLDNLIGGMLAYSRAGKLTTNPEAVNLNQLLYEIIDELSPPGTMNIVIDPGMPVVYTNKAAITQVFLNLMSNAIKYNDKKSGKIRIGYQSFKDFHQFYITDNGPGIDIQYHGKIFEIFKTLQSQDMIESSGIGLSIVKKILEKQGGKIWLTSAIGQGTTFYFTWPLS